jgi:hypothetical protein
MATEAQILANRRNAQKSTGTRTREGKVVVSQNAIKHGFFARQDRIGGKTYEVLTTFYAKQSQFPKSQNECKRIC